MTLRRGIHAVGTLLSAAALTASAQVNITTWQADAQHTGRNLAETILTPALVGSPGNFGFLFSQPMDGQSYGQPLYVSGLDIGGTSHNVVYLTTEHDSVYAFDADSDVGSNAPPIWHRSLLPAGTTPVPQSEVGSGDISVEIGITATPVIDLASQTLYTVSKVKVTASSTYQQWLHALDLKTGAEKFGGPVLINPTFAGSGVDAVNGVMPFQPLRENDRAAMALNNGIVYVTYASHGDTQPYHGLILGFDAATLALVKTFNATPNSSAAGIWQGGASPAFDSAGNLYVATGNGAFDQNSSPYTTGTNWGQAYLKLPPDTFTVSFSNPLNWFVPSNVATLNFGDIDLGASGLLLLPDQAGPHPHLLVGGGKGGTLYVIDRDSMGGFAAQNNSVQEITETNGIFATPAYFNNSIYYAPIGGKLTQRTVGYNPVDGSYLSAATSKSNFTYSSGLGAGVFISANGTQNGLVWAIDRGNPAHLHAYDATSVAGDPIFTGSATLPGNVNCAGVKFSLPTVANGKVYFATFDANNVGHLFVFGRPVAVAGTPAAPSNVVATPDASGKIVITWTDNSNNELGFTIKRSTSPNGTFVALATNANANETSFVDATADPATQYYYQVVAFNANGNSTPSQVATGTTFPSFTQPDLVAYWNFDEGAGGTANDETGNGIDGTLAGEVTWSAGFCNTALHFHGAGAATSRVLVPDAAGLRFAAGASFTLSAWVNPSALRSADEAVIAKSRDTGNYYGIWINSANQWVFRGPGGDVVGSAVAQGVWTHVAVVQDGNAGLRRIYVNGVLAGTGAAQAADGTGAFWIGQANSGGNTVIDTFPGDIDEVRLYKRALTASQILTLLPPPVLQATSSQVSGVAGAYGRVLSPSKIKVIEPRKGTVAGQYKVILYFAAPVSGLSASLTLQNGGPAVGSVGTVSYDSSAKIVSVNLSGVADVQALNLHLSGIQPGGGTADIPLNILWGDVDQDNVVTHIDAVLVQKHHEPWVDPTNAFYDLNADGVVDAQDDAIVTQNLGTNLGPQTDTNLSAIGTATASSVEQDVTPASAAIDGLLNTRWSSLSSDPQWITVDLGDSFTIHSVVLDWENAAGKDYTIQVSGNNATWTTVWTETNNISIGFKTYSGAAVTGRYVRVYCTARLTQFGDSLWEFQIFGVYPPIDSPPSITSALTKSGNLGTPLSYQITATSNPTSFAATGLPEGLNVNPGTGLITGTPTKAGTTKATIKAINASGTGSAYLDFTIAPGAESNLSVGQPSQASLFEAGNLVAYGNDADTVNTRWASGSTTFPQWWRVDLGGNKILSRVDIKWFNPTTRAYQYKVETSLDDSTYQTVLDRTSNTTAGDSPGSLSATGRYVRITVTGSSSGGFASFWDCSVQGTAAPMPPAITSAGSASGTRGTAFSYQITASNTPTQFAATGLPAGLAVDAATGVISGIPTTAGTFTPTITASNAGGPGSASLTITIAPSPVSVLLSAASRQTHGTAGALDLALPLSGTCATEARNGAVAGTYNLVLTFSAPVSALTATLQRQAGQAGTAIGTVGAVSYNGSVVTVPLSGVGNAQRLNLHLTGIQPGDGAADVPFNVLAGDVNSDAAVNVLDIGQVKLRAGHAADATTLQYDVNVDGTIDVADQTATRAKSGTVLP